MHACMRDGRRARGMRYASTRAVDVRRDALRHAVVGDGSEAAAVKLREAIEAYEMTEEEEEAREDDEDDEDDDETVTFDDAMTGATRRGGCGSKARAYTAMDIVRAIPVMKCEETTAWMGRDETFPSARAFAPTKISIDDRGRDGGETDTRVTVRNASRSGMAMVEVPVVDDDDETRRAMRVAISEASFKTASERLFELDDDALDALECVENDLQKRYDVVSETSATNVDAMRSTKIFKEFTTLFPSCRETVATDETSFTSPLAHLLSIAEDVSVCEKSVRFEMDPAVKGYLKNLVFQGHIDLPMKYQLDDIAKKVDAQDTGRASPFMETFDADTMGADINSSLKSLTIRAGNVETIDERDELDDDFYRKRAKETVTQKFINFDESKLQSMVVPQMKKDDDIARADDAMRSIMETVQVAKEIAPALSKWKVPFPNLFDVLEQSNQVEKAAQIPQVFEEIRLEDDGEDWTWDSMPLSNVVMKDPDPEQAAAPKLSESLSFHKKRDTDECSIEIVEIDPDSCQLDLIKVLADRYAYISQILPLDVQRMIPRFQLDASDDLKSAIRYFEQELPLMRHLQSLLCCQAAASLVHVYGFHMANVFMRRNVREEYDLSDIKTLIERQDAREDVDHPKMRLLKNYVTQLVVTGGKMLIIFPNTMGLFQVKSFVSKMNMRTSQFDGKQEFIHISRDDADDFVHAVEFAASKSDVVFVLEDHVSHDFFPLHLFETCVYYAPSDGALETIQSVGSSRHAVNNSIHVLAMKENELFQRSTLEPASSALEQPRKADASHDPSFVCDDEEQLLHETTMFDSTQHVVVFNTARQIVQAREGLFAQVQQRLSRHNAEVLCRRFVIDTDACVTVGDDVHGVILIVPEYFAEGLPTQLELFSIVEDLMVAMANSFYAGTIIYEGDIEFLQLAKSLERRLRSDSLQMNITIHLQYCLEEELVPTLYDVLRPRRDQLSDLHAPISTEPSEEELRLCEIYPLLNPISACALLNNESVRRDIQKSYQVSLDTIKSLQLDNIGFPLSVLSREKARAEYPDVPGIQFLSPIKRQRLDDSAELNSLSLESSLLHSTPRRRPHSLFTHGVDTPSPVLNLDTSPTPPPRSLLPSPPVAQRRRLTREFESEDGGRLRSTARVGDGPSTSTSTRLDKRHPPEFPAMLEQFRMPTERPQRAMQRSLAQHRFTKITSKSQRLPDTWK